MLAVLHARRRRGRTGSASSAACCASAADADRIADGRSVLLGRNWIWHWGGQMWYMQPCWPDLRATRFWRVFMRLERFRTGKAGRKPSKAAKQADTNWNLNG